MKNDLNLDLNEEPVDNTETSCDDKLNFNEISTKLSKDIATTYNDWFILALHSLIYITVKL
jgi:hypothetical protein